MNYAPTTRLIIADLSSKCYTIVMTHTVIVGAGMAGVKAALELARAGGQKITLISPDGNFHYNAALYSVVIGRRSDDLTVPLKQLFQDYKSVKIVKDEIRKINPKTKSVKGKTKYYKYDNLVLATGLGRQLYGTSGRSGYSYGASLPESMRHLHKAFHDLVTSDRPGEAQVLIAGGGSVGVELAGALAEYLERLTAAHQLKNSTVQILLIEARRRLLPNSSKTASRLVTRRLRKKGVRVVTSQRVVSRTGRSVAIRGRNELIDLLVYTSGGQNSSLILAHPEIFKLSKRGRVIVNHYLQTYPNIFVIGDAAETLESGFVATALAHGKFIAKHLTRLAKGQPPKSRPAEKRRVLSVPVGRFWAYSEFCGLYVAGFTGSLVRRLVELHHYNQLMPLATAYKTWRRYRTSHENCKLCQKIVKN